MSLILPFPDDLQLARQLAASQGGELASVEWHRFPDQESLITIKCDCTGHDVAIVCTLQRFVHSGEVRMLLHKRTREAETDHIWTDMQPYGIALGRRTETFETRAA